MHVTMVTPLFLLLVSTRMGAMLVQVVGSAKTTRYYHNDVLVVPPVAATTFLSIVKLLGILTFHSLWSPVNCYSGYANELGVLTLLIK